MDDVNRRHRRRVRGWGTAAVIGAAAFLPQSVIAAAPAGNGDVNADGTIDLSDAVYLLSHLYLGGKAPVPIACTDAHHKPKFRFYNTIACGDTLLTAALSICGLSASRLGGEPPTDCQELDPADPSCQVKVEAVSDCGVISLCADIPVQENHLYDVILAVDVLGPFAIWVDRLVLIDGTCPGFPRPGDTPAGDFLVCPTGGDLDAGALDGWESFEGGWR